MILDDIIEKRKIQLEKEMSKVPFETIKQQAFDTDFKTKGFKSALSNDRLSVICEVKKASPSKGLIRPDFHPLEIAKEYESAGADAISCLTEEYYFQGSSEYLKSIAECVSIPILRKDFIIDEYQIYEARAIGASAILLIAAILDRKLLTDFISLLLPCRLTAL